MTYHTKSKHILPKITDRLSFLYIDQSTINRKDYSLTVESNYGQAAIPVNIINTLLLGPGVSMTHRAIELAAKSGVSLIWVGTHGAKCYSTVHPLSTNTKFLERQAKYSTHRNHRIRVAREMYAMRFDDDVSTHTMQQLRGKEGTRMKKIYRTHAKEYGIEWHGRQYDPNDFSSGDLINRSLSIANDILYAVCLGVVSSLGMSNGLGFVHTGHSQSFIYDLADLYKANTSIPIAFQVASSIVDENDLQNELRTAMRKVFKDMNIAKRMIDDIHTLFDIDSVDESSVEVMFLWDDRVNLVGYGVNYSKVGA